MFVYVFYFIFKINTLTNNLKYKTLFKTFFFKKIIDKKKYIFFIENWADKVAEPTKS
jgi:hypothetical protein